jgi:hypothetical protein
VTLSCTLATVSLKSTVASAPTLKVIARVCGEKPASSAEIS